MAGEPVLVHGPGNAHWLGIPIPRRSAHYLLLCNNRTDPFPWER
jgi:hypothetical protein